MTIARLRKALAAPLPGPAAQARMLPPYRSAEFHAPQGSTEFAYREAAVLVLLYPLEGRLFFPLTKRSDALRKHGGQMSLPGGAREKGESLLQAALRETEEEIGVVAADIEPLGALSNLRVAPSRYEVTPFVGGLAERPSFRSDEREVAELVEVSINELLSPESEYEATRFFEGRLWSVPCFRLCGREVWGATAMMLAELRQVALALGAS